jgi:hypothetical protein
MRFIAVRIAWLGIAMAAAAAASGCAQVERGTVAVARVKVDTVGIAPDIRGEMIRVDPEEAAERALIGGLLGGVLGASLGATASANAAFGALVGGSAGAALGSAVGVATTRPLPSYTPIAVPTAPVIPGFYDTWPPGYGAPPAGAQVPPPPSEWSPEFGARIMRGDEPASATGPALVEVPPPAAL